MAMNSNDALDAIAQLMNGKEWDADTLEAIAEILEAAGYEIDPPSDDEDGEDE